MFLQSGSPDTFRSGTGVFGSWGGHVEECFPGQVLLVVGSPLPTGSAEGGQSWAWQGRRTLLLADVLSGGGHLIYPPYWFCLTWHCW